MEEVKRDRARRKLLRVTFPNGKVLCYKEMMHETNMTQ